MWNWWINGFAVFILYNALFYNGTPASASCRITHQRGTTGRRSKNRCYCLSFRCSRCDSCGIDKETIQPADALLTADKARHGGQQKGEQAFHFTAAKVVVEYKTSLPCSLLFYRELGFSFASWFKNCASTAHISIHISRHVLFLIHFLFCKRAINKNSSSILDVTLNL